MVRRKRRLVRRRIGRVSLYLHHGAWWVYYREGGRPVRQRVADSEAEAEQVAARLNLQLSSHSPTLLSFQPVSVAELRDKFLQHHELILKSSVATVHRYRAATQHLLDFAGTTPVHTLPADRFALFLRNREVSPNGHARTAKRKLRDKGVLYILQTCRSLYAYAIRMRHLPPYSENPFSQLRIDKLQIEDAKPIFVFDQKSELAFLQAADDWSFPIHFTLAKTGLRVGELTHLLIEEIDFETGWLHIRNKAELGWRIKTRNERSVPLVSEVVAVLRHVIGNRDRGPVLLQHSFQIGGKARHQYEFVQDAVDYGTRVICIGDNLDTADPNWEVMMGAATLRHGLHIPDTRRRVRRTAEYTFHQGGMVLMVRYGYRKLTKVEADSGRFGPVGLRLTKLPEATSVIQEIRRRVLSGQEYEMIADWLNDQGISPGPYVKSGRWAGKTVVDLLKDPLLQGIRRFRQLIYEPIFKTGKHRRRKNSNPEIEVVPELAHFTPEEQGELWEVMKDRGMRNGQKSGRQNPRYGVPRHRGIWPSKHVCCAVCGDLMERTLNDQLKCKNAFEKGAVECWNHVQVKAEVIRQKVLPPLLHKLEQHAGFRQTLLESAWKSYSQRLQRSQRQLSDFDDQLQKLEQEQENLVQAIRVGGKLSSLITELKDLEGQIKSVGRNRKGAEDQLDLQGFSTQEEFAVHLEEAILETARSNFDFTDLMRDHVTEFVIQPVQPLDSTQVYPRAKLTLRLPTEEGEPAVEIRIEADCFTPSRQVMLLERCRQTKAQHPRSIFENGLQRSAGDNSGIHAMGNLQSPAQKT